MRVNCRSALSAFLRGRSLRPASSIWSNGDQLYSYSTCLAARLADGRLVLNRTRYSVTTTIHQNALAAYFGPEAIHVDGLRFGAVADDLREAAEGAAVCA